MCRRCGAISHLRSQLCCAPAATAPPPLPAAVATGPGPTEARPSEPLTIVTVDSITRSACFAGNTGVCRRCGVTTHLHTQLHCSLGAAAPPPLPAAVATGPGTREAKPGEPLTVVTVDSIARPACFAGTIGVDDNDQTGPLGYRDAGEAGPPRGRPRDDHSGGIVGNIDSSLPQAKPGGGHWGRERGCGGGKNQGEHSAGVPCNPPATRQASEARVEGRPSDGPYGDDS